MGTAFRAKLIDIEVELSGDHGMIDNTGLMTLVLQPSLSLFGSFSCQSNIMPHVEYLFATAWPPSPCQSQVPV